MNTDVAETKENIAYAKTQNLWEQLWRTVGHLECELRKEPYGLLGQRAQVAIPALLIFGEGSGQIDVQISAKQVDSESSPAFLGPVHQHGLPTSTGGKPQALTRTDAIGSSLSSSKESGSKESGGRVPAVIETGSWEQEILSCQACHLGQKETRIRQQAIVGYPEQCLGRPEQVQLLIVCDVPNYDADCRHTPLPSDNLEYLGKWLEAIQMHEHYYLTNLVKCRTPGNRAAWPEEIKSCLLHLHKQISFFRPSAILALGSSAARSLSQQRSSSLNTLRNRVLYFQAGERSLPLAVTYSVAEVLDNPNELRAPVWQDLKRLHALLQNQT